MYHQKIHIEVKIKQLTDSLVAIYFNVSEIHSGFEKSLLLFHLTEDISNLDNVLTRTGQTLIDQGIPDFFKALDKLEYFCKFTNELLNILPHSIFLAKKTKDTQYIKFELCKYKGMSFKYLIPVSFSL